MTPNETKLQALHTVYDNSVQAFNDGHRLLKHMKQGNYQLLKEIEALTKTVLTERANARGQGALAD